MDPQHPIYPQRVLYGVMGYCLHRGLADPKHPLNKTRENAPAILTIFVTMVTPLPQYGAGMATI